MRLTNAKVKAAENTNGKPVWLYDDELTGLALTVSPKGKKSWYVVVWKGGKKWRKKLGAWPAVNATEARELAKVTLGELAKGKDFERKEKAKRLTVGDLWEHWFTHHSKPEKRTWERDQRDYDRLLRPVLHDVLLADVDRDDVVKLLTTVQGEQGKGPAIKTRALLSAMFEYAIDYGWLTDNPVRKTPRPKYDARQRYLKADEVSRFFAAVNSLQSETARDFFLMCLWTGGRRDNVGSMAWEELDLTTRVWIIPARKYKGKKPHTIPLSAPAMEILKRRLKGRKDGARYVFPGRGKRGYFSDPKGSWNRVKELSGIPDLRIHDLRRSLGAWQNAGGDSIRLIQQTLGHSTVAVTASFYTPTEVEPIRASMDAVAVKMLAAANGKGVE